MNIFFLSKNTNRCARYHVDKHVVKMILEYCQMLCAFWHVLDPTHELFHPPYKKAYVNHPSTIWVRSSKKHYVWLCALAKELCTQYTERYGKTHASEKLVASLEHAIARIPASLPDTWADPPQCMPNEYKSSTSSKLAYRKFYKFGKKNSLHAWKHGCVPYFMKSISFKLGTRSFHKSLSLDEN